jgi:hypothetical protein
MDDLLEEFDALDRSTPADRDRRRRVVATVAICGLAFVGIGQLATGAVFNDSADASITYTTGDVQIEANSSASVTLPAAGNLAPGDTVYRPLTVTNVGSLDLRYALVGQTTTDSKNLSTQLAYTIYSGVSAAQCSAGNVGGGTAVVSSVPIPTTAVNLIGNPAMGKQSNERSIAAGAGADVLCLAMALPLATTSAYANASATVQLTFDAEQTDNNP